MELAERVGAEIVSADSQAVYRHFDLGTAKPGPELLARVRHHLGLRRRARRAILRGPLGRCWRTRPSPRRPRAGGGCWWWVGPGCTSGCYSTGSPTRLPTRRSVGDWRRRRARSARKHCTGGSWQSTRMPPDRWRSPTCCGSFGRWRSTPPPACSPRASARSTASLRPVTRRGSGSSTRRARSWSGGSASGPGRCSRAACSTRWSGWSQPATGTQRRCGAWGTARRWRCSRVGLDRAAAEAETLLETRRYAKRQRTWFRREPGTRFVAPPYAEVRTALGAG